MAGYYQNQFAALFFKPPFHENGTIIDGRRAMKNGTPGCRCSRWFVRRPSRGHSHRRAESQRRQSISGPGRFELPAWLAKPGMAGRVPLQKQEQIQGPKNGSIARFFGLGCYQTRSGKTPKQARASVVRLWRRAAAIGSKGRLTVRAGGPFWSGCPAQRARWFGPQPALMGL